MSDSPPLIGRSRPSTYGLNLGVAVPLRGGPYPDELRVPKTAEELRADREAARDAVWTVTRCAFCEWSFEGTAGEGRVEALEHRAAEHPEALTSGRRRRRKAPLTRPEVKMTDAEYDEAIRARREREETDRLAKIERGRQRHALEAMDAGEPQQPVELEEAPEFGTDGAGVSSSPSGSPSSPVSSGAAAPSPSGDDGATPTDQEEPMNENGRAKTRQEIISAVERFRSEHGRMPLPSDAADADYLPTRELGRRGDPGFESWQAIWDHFAAGKLPKGRAAGAYRGTAVSGSGRAASRAPASRNVTAGRPATPEPGKVAGVRSALAHRILEAAAAVDKAEIALRGARADLDHLVQELAST